MLDKKWKLVDRVTENYESHSYTVIVENASTLDEDGYEHYTTSGFDLGDLIADDHPYYNSAPTKEVMKYLVDLHNANLEKKNG